MCVRASRLGRGAGEHGAGSGAETFIDPGRFRGTCYRAANWKLLGLTTGRGKNDHTYKPNRPIKEVLGLPLTPRFRELLQAGIA